MSLREKLSGIVENLDGGRAVVIMAYDGIPIDEVVVNQAGFDLQQLTVEYATLLKDIRRAAEVLKVGDMEEISITTGQLIVIMRMLNEELFIVLIMDREGNTGKGRYLLRLNSYDLVQELN